MIENYFQRIESIITPITYSKDNLASVKIQLDNSINITTTPDKFKPLNKPIGSNTSINRLVLTDDPIMQNLISSEGFIPEKQERVKKLKKETEGKLEYPPEIHSNIIMRNTYTSTSMNNVNSQIDYLKQIRSKSLNQIDINNLNKNDIKGLIDKIQALSTKNMSNRFDIEQMRRKIEEKTKENKEVNLLIEKYQQEKEESCKYLLKLESMLLKSNQITRRKRKYISSNEKTQKTKNKIDFSSTIGSKKSSLSEFESLSNKRQYSSNSNNRYFDNRYFKKKKEKKVLIAEDNTIRELKNDIERLIKENNKLKKFQEEVYIISKTYDDINENLRDAFQAIRNHINSNNDSDSDNRDIILYYDSIMKKVDETLQIKQKEYNMILEEKDDQIKVLKDELYIMAKEVENRKEDRLKEQIKFKEQENQIRTLQDQLLNFNENSRRLTNNNCNQFHNSNISVDNKVSRTIEPVKKTINVLINKIEKEFNLSDKNTATFLSKISKNMK